MLAAMEPRQFDEWLAEHDLEPWGDQRRYAASLNTIDPAGHTARHPQPLPRRYLTALESWAKDRMNFR